MKTITRTRMIGGSIVVTIPKELVKEEQLKPGQLVEIDIKRPKKSFFGIAKGIGSFTKEDELVSHE